MINKYREFSSLNESLYKPKFNVGDAVTVNDNILKFIEYCGWTIKMKEYIGGTFFINKIEYDDYIGRYKYYIQSDVFIFDDCLNLINFTNEHPKIRWYKKGKLENDE